MQDILHIPADDVISTMVHALEIFRAQFFRQSCVQVPLQVFRLPACGSAAFLSLFPGFLNRIVNGALFGIRSIRLNMAFWRAKVGTLGNGKTWPISDGYLILTFVVSRTGIHCEPYMYLS